MERENISIVEDDCFGCGVCQTVCPTKVINLKTNSDGFIKPYINNINGCIHCGLCLGICSYYNRNRIEFKRCIASVAAWVNDCEYRRNSSSGGIVPIILKKYLEKGYNIYCVDYDYESNQLKYFSPTTINDLNKGMKSKYLQAFFPYKIDYKSNNVIVGTPCAISSIREIIEKKKLEETNILIDFFCHGTPSYLLWKKYLEHIGINHPIRVIWRNKDNGWHDSWRMIVEDNKTIFSKYFSQGDLFYKFFLRNRCLRKSCYDDCVFKSLNSKADIRVGDLWGTKYSNDEKGVSGVLVFTNKGLQVLADVQDECTIIKETVEVITESQMKACAKRPSSFNFVKIALHTDISLGEIDKTASRIELFQDIIPTKIKYYCKRIIPKLLGK